MHSAEAKACTNYGLHSEASWDCHACAVLTEKVNLRTKVSLALDLQGKHKVKQREIIQFKRINLAAQHFNRNHKLAN